MNAVLKRSISIIALLAVVITMSFSGVGADEVFADEGTETVSPLIVVTGSDFLGSSNYTENNISKEISYTFEELNEMASKDTEASEDNTYLYSTLNTWNTTSIYKAEGIRVIKLLEAAGVQEFSSSKLTFKATDGYKVVFDPGRKTPGTKDEPRYTTGILNVRYYFSNIGMLDTENMTAQSINNAEKEKEETPAIIAWARTDNKGNTNPEKLGEMSRWDNDKVQVIVGQLSANEYNNPLWNGETSCITVIIGNDMQSIISINGKSYSRAGIMANDYILDKYQYTDETTGEAAAKYIKGVYVADFFKAFDDNDAIKMSFADNNEPVVMTKADIKENKYVIAYEAGDKKENLNAIVNTDKTDNSVKGYLTLYGNNIEPIKNIDKISVLEAPGNFKATSAGYDKVKLTWDPVNGASGYTIEMYDSKTKRYINKKSVSGISAHSTEISGLKTGTKYYYRIKSYITVDGEKKYGDISSSKYATPSLSRPSITKLSAGSKKVTVKWTKVSGAKGYKLYRATSKSGKYKFIKTTGSNYYTNKSLQKGKKYYYKVKAYRVVDGKSVYSSYSAVKYIKAK